MAWRSKQAVAVKTQGLRRPTFLMFSFRLLGIPFQVTWYFWLGAAIVGSNVARGEHAALNLVLWMLCVLVSITVHELGHALAGRHYGIRTHVVLHIMGGLTFLPGARLNRSQNILVVMAGPAAGFALWGLMLLVERFLESNHYFHDTNELDLHVMNLLVGEMLWINLYWSLFNLLPIYPLDGGQILRDVVGPRHMQVTYTVGAALAAGLCVYMALQGRLYNAFLLGSLAYSNYQGGAGGGFTGGVQRG